MLTANSRSCTTSQLVWKRIRSHCMHMHACMAPCTGYWCSVSAIRNNMHAHACLHKQLHKRFFSAVKSADARHAPCCISFQVLTMSRCACEMRRGRHVVSTWNAARELRAQQSFRYAGSFGGCKHATFSAQRSLALLGSRILGARQMEAAECSRLRALALSSRTSI